MDDIQDGTTKGEHCPYCGEKIIYTKNKITGNMVPCRCKCEEKREEEEEKRRIEAERKNMIINAKYECFNHKSMWEQTFENDNGLNAKMYVAKDCVANLEKDLKEKNGTSIITVRKIYIKYISIELLQKKRHIDIEYYVS